MFWKKEKPAEIFKDVMQIRANRAGASRRATSMIPLAASGTTHEVAHTGAVRFHQLLISLEGNQRTGCLRIISPKRKSRSAILIYKGRVVGCLYGCKKMDYTCLQEDAHKAALADLAQPGNILDAYELPEELVLAAASLFNGDVMNIDTRLSSHEMFEQALHAIAESRLPGCIVINTMDEEMVCMIYVFDGKIIGVFSAKDGWVKPTYEVAVSYLKNAHKSTKVMASYLPVQNQQQAQSLGFSLTGLGDTKRRTFMVQQQLQAIDSFTTIRSEASTYTNLEPITSGGPRVQVAAGRKVPARLALVSTSTNVSALPSHNVFAIAP